MTARRLLFVSPQFLFPMDAGGKIRTVNILKRLKGGAFEIDLIAPVSELEREKWKSEIEEVCDAFTPWQPEKQGLLRELKRGLSIFSPLPISVRSEARRAAKNILNERLATNPDIVVFDYVHSTAMAPKAIDTASVFFAHNVETEIFERHAKLTKGLARTIWRLEAAKMANFEEKACRKFGGIIAVSARDAALFQEKFSAQSIYSIPTGVDLNFFHWRHPKREQEPTLVFTGSMDWRANQDGLKWFMDEVWPLVIAKVPEAFFKIVGKNPPPWLEMAARDRGYQWQFTGYVDDIRDHIDGSVYVIPLRAGGGTRIKAYEAMASGIPVVSTGLGVEGLEVRGGLHYLQADSADSFAQSVVTLLQDFEKRASLSKVAREHCEQNFSQEAVATEFENHCLNVVAKES